MTRLRARGPVCGGRDQATDIGGRRDLTTRASHPPYLPPQRPPRDPTPTAPLRASWTPAPRAVTHGAPSRHLYLPRGAGATKPGAHSRAEWLPLYGRRGERRAGVLGAGPTGSGRRSGRTVARPRDRVSDRNPSSPTECTPLSLPSRLLPLLVGHASKV